MGLRDEEGYKIRGKGNKSEADKALKRLRDLPNDEERQHLYDNAPKTPPRCKEDKSGYVYFVTDEQKHWVKIGRTKNTPKRLEALQTSCPLRLVLATRFFSDDAPKAETELHQRFEKYQHRGEWFWLDGKLLDYVKEVKSG